ncbi:MAG: DNA primase, partial [Lachnospiraceae bacterium]|nr:DNA primase [Lachnospiraceae bacterium]
MYYSQEVVDEVLRGNDIVDIVSSHVHLQKRGANYQGLCPFHNEKTPSFNVSPSRQIFKCFGCGVGGNALTFLMKYDNLSFQEALQQLADRAGVKLPEADQSEKSKKRQEEREQLLAVNKEAATYYFRLLRSPRGKKGMEYLTGRDLSPQTMQKFGLGYADGRNNDLVKMLKEKGFSDEVILKAGVAAFDEKRGMHDKFWNRVMFPIQDTGNRVIGFGGRVMGDGKPKYLNSPETPVFDKSRNLYGLNMAKRTKKPYFILCEGYMDVIAMHQAGFTEAVASLGTAFTQQQALLIRRYVKNVLLAYDSDGAGVQAALRNIKIIRGTGLNGRVIDLRPYKDPDEFIKALGAEEFEKRIEHAENGFFYEIRQLEGGYRMDDPAQRTDFSHEIARRLCEFTDEIERSNYLREMARKYFIDEDSLKRAVASYGRAGAGTPEGMTAPPSRPERTARDQGEKKKKTPSAASDLRSQRLLLTWLIDDPGLYPQIREYFSPEDFEEGIY